MSVNVSKVPVVYVNDPLINSTQTRKSFAIIRSGKYKNFQSIPVNSGYSNSGYTVNLNTPSPGLYLDRTIVQELPVTLTFTGTSQPGGTLLNQGFDAFRFLPIASITNTLSFTLNGGMTTTIQLSQCIQQLARCNVGSLLKNNEWSTTVAGAMDCSQNYEDLANSVRNPLASYEDSNSGTGVDGGRGGFGHMRVLTNTSTSATVTATLTEPLFISPIHFGRQCDNDDAFYNIKNLTINVNFTNGNLLQRIWSHSNASGSVLTNVDVSFGVPTIYVNYITPSLLAQPDMPINEEIYEWNYNDFQQFQQNSGLTVTPNSDATVLSQNINLASNPTLIMLCVYNKPFENMTLNDSDCFMRINNISVSYKNQSGLLSSASREQLYYMSVRNGLQMSYSQFSGVVQRFIGGNLSRYGLTGSVVLINPALDLFMQNPLEAQSMSTSTQIQIQVNVTNINQTVNANPCVSMVVVSNGIMTMVNGQPFLSTTPVTPVDVLDAQHANVPFSELQNSIEGGSFSGFLKGVWNTLKNEVIPVVKDVLPLVSPVRAILGRGEGGCGDCGNCSSCAGVLVGGKRRGAALVNTAGALVSRKSMKHRLMP